LEQPLIGLGFADTREEVDAMVSLVDEDGSGNIEFPEFLGIIKNSGGNEKSQKIY
jgi:Ca2+-binding EF-hand superfamily protein